MIEAIREKIVDVNGLKILIRQETIHTINSYTMDMKPIGCCSIGEFSNNRVTERDWKEMLKEFKKDPMNHPLVTG